MKKSQLIAMFATTPVYAAIIVYLVSLLFFLFIVTNIEDAFGMFFMGLIALFLFIVSLGILYFKLLSQYIYGRLKLETFTAMAEKNLELLNEFVKNDYQIIKKTPKYILEKKSEFNISLLIVYLLIGILPGIIYLIVVSEIGSHTVSFELGGKVYKDVTIDMNNNKVVYNS